MQETSCSATATDIQGFPINVDSIQKTSESTVLSLVGRSCQAQTD
jgi:hypothetical protein